MAPAVPPMPAPEALLPARPSAKSTGKLVPTGNGVDRPTRLFTDENPPVRLSANDTGDCVPNGPKLTPAVKPPKPATPDPKPRTPPDGKPVAINPDVLPETLKLRKFISRVWANADEDSHRLNPMSPLASRFKVIVPQGGLPAGMDPGPPMVKLTVSESADAIGPAQARNSRQSVVEIQVLTTMFRIPPRRRDSSPREM